MGLAYPVNQVHLSYHTKVLVLLAFIFVVHSVAVCLPLKTPVMLKSTFYYQLLHISLSFLYFSKLLVGPKCVHVC